jgi:hypothetical protein
MVFFLIVALLFVPPLSLHAQDQSMHNIHTGMSMPMDESMTPAAQAKLLADKRESEFNHHLAGFLVILASLLILVEAIVRDRWLWVRYAWPVCFLLSGLFVRQLRFYFTTMRIPRQGPGAGRRFREQYS